MRRAHTHLVELLDVLDVQWDVKEGDALGVWGAGRHGRRGRWRTMGRWQVGVGDEDMVEVEVVMRGGGLVFASAPVAGGTCFDGVARIALRMLWSVPLIVV